MTDLPLSDGDRRPVHEMAFRVVGALEADASIDRRAELLDRLAAPVAHGPAGSALRGHWIGHAVHPFMTDLPLGCWTAASILDLVGGRAARPAARRLTGIGLLGAVPTALTGLVEFDRLEAQPTRRVATAHAVGNSIALGFQLLSWRARRKQRHARGVAWGLAGNSVAAAAGFLGGHMAFADGVGVGRRTPQDERPEGGSVEEDTASEPQAAGAGGTAGVGIPLVSG